MNPLKTGDEFRKYHNGSGCGDKETDCISGFSCKYDHTTGNAAKTADNYNCPYEWQCTLSYPGRYD